ncbi:MAG: N-6 DNA methylase [Planctomycetaceae bacterium]|jgi:hypothetical protein|nr:N-6 DNA methylase [Planctomycetaceae bacterium]
MDRNCRKKRPQKIYEELRNWYFRAAEASQNPDGTLRIIIRLLLCFFLREKKLIPAPLFEYDFCNENLKEEDCRYYKVILRNLFFGSLNTPMSRRGELENKNLIKNDGILKKLFYQKIPFLNGGLFTEHPGDNCPLPDLFFFSKPLLQTPKESGGKYPAAGIVDILSQYPYTLNETGDSECIDPEFIGRIFECLLAYIEAGGQKSRRKMTGSYYTPREIVDYMVNEGLNTYFADGSENHRLEDLKILDPACGCGAFPCGILNALMQRIDPHKTLPPQERYQKKSEILRNVIYGIDIQPMAVQITVLRLFLSLIQDIQPDPEKENFGIEPLPDIANFTCRNALLNVHSAEKFDIVIGNPPYGADYPPEQKEYFRNNYQSAKTIKNKQKGSMDTFSLFIENGFHALKKGGYLTFIVPMTAVSSDAATGLHRLLETQCSTIKVLSLSDRPQQIFPQAHQKTSVISFCKDGLPNRSVLSTQMYRKDKHTALQTLISGITFAEVAGLGLPGRYAKISLPVEQSILQKLREIKTTIGTLRQKEGKAIYYRTAGGEYYKVITDFPTGSMTEKVLFFDTKIAGSIGAVLSSSLLWWYNQVYTCYPSWKTSEIESFPIPADKLTLSVTGRIEKLYASYLQDIKKHVREHQTKAYRNVQLFREFKIRYSKPLIDKIDDAIAPLYGLTDEERDFIKNYEIRFRADG